MSFIAIPVNRRNNEICLLCRHVFLLPSRVELAVFDALDFGMVYSGVEFNFVFIQPAIPYAHLKGSTVNMKFMCRQFYVSVDFRNNKLPGQSSAE
jgi:hypothetical protein